ncbi:hypothetical protein [endosymbiont GvMRE of Glomus versiforme]|uniref:hypothetical protein n=1 Tax=endosymbiont GvMRE of Glomus versiforme TaxID=2039283 RepID=UPI000ED3FB17|nr:hypothetical protein [endosymbiont GvMRE of Glomus versiforme]RHZ35405.1 hypothetical protein GvMRE_IIg559 [endosymbiont GvMRE of Glomus versiforme]
MTKDAKKYLDENIMNKGKIYSLDISNRDLAETEEKIDLKEFTNLTRINASNNKFANLEWIFTLPNKEKLKWLNFWGNEINQVDFAYLFNNFPNLNLINLENNPLGGKNLNELNPQQFTNLVKSVEEKKLKINSWKGTFLIDLLKYTEQLLKKQNQTSQEELIAQQFQQTYLSRND